MVDSCLLQRSVVIWLHMSPHDVCAVRAVLCLFGSVHISWSTCLCIHSWIGGRFSWRAVHHNSMQGLFLQTFTLTSRLLSRSSAPWSWGDVVRADFRHIQCQNHPLLRKIGWGAIYDARDQILWLPRSILPSRVACAAGHWRYCLTVVRHSIPGESQNKYIHSWPFAWDYIPKLILGECPIFLCAHTQVNPLRFGGKTFLRQIRQSMHCDKTEYS